MGLGGFEVYFFPQILLSSPLLFHPFYLFIKSFLLILFPNSRFHLSLTSGRNPRLSLWLGFRV